MRVGRDAAPAGVVHIITSPGGSWSKPGGRTMDALRSRTRRRQIAVDAAVARRLARRTRTVRRTRRPRVIPEAKLRKDLRVIQVTRHLGAPYPSLRGRKKRRATPRPNQVRGPRSMAV